MTTASHTLRADMHTHSEHSHDSTAPIAATNAAATAAGLDLMAVTDHCDVFYHESKDITTPLLRQCEDILALNEEGVGTRLLCGVEISEGFWYPEVLKKVTNLAPYDVIIGSVHALSPLDKLLIYSAENFGVWSEEELHGFLATYFRDMQTMLDEVDFDILAHLSCPLRYINGKYGRGITLERHEDAIEKILEKVIARGISLEVNTSSLSLLGAPMPDYSILKAFRQMGGRYITVGSDAHTPERVAEGIDTVTEKLREIGFTHATYFEGRKRRTYAL